MITASEYTTMLASNAEDTRLEQRIDLAIRDQGESGRDRDITLTIGGWDREVIDRVLARYCEADWNAQLVSDSRDGDFISMRRK